MASTSKNKTPKKKKGKKAPKNVATGMTKFIPNEPQLRWLEAALDPEIPPVIERIAIAASVSKQSWYEWKKKPDFMAWWEEQWTLGMQQNGWFLDKVGLQKSVKDFRYWETMQMKFLKFARKTEVEDTTDYSQLSLSKRKKLLEVLTTPE